MQFTALGILSLLFADILDPQLEYKAIVVGTLLARNPKS